MDKNQIYKIAFKQFCYFCLWIIAVRFTKGAALVLMTLAGVIWAFRDKVGSALSIHLMMMFMAVLNLHILDKSGMLYGLGLRLGPLMIGLALAFKGIGGRGNMRLPMGTMLIYLAVAGISSAHGWAPRISYMKLVNFVIFFIGTWVGTKNLSRNSQEVMILRATFIAIATFLILGSIALYPFPGISTLQGLTDFKDIDDVAVINAIMREKIEGGAKSYFCGVTYQSQALSPLLSCAFAWIVCDLLFVEERFRWPHVILIVGSLPLLYLTRSRVAFLSISVTMAFVYLYLPRKIKLSPRIKKWQGTVLFAGGVLLVGVAAITEIQNDAISRWVRKVDDVDSDRRSLAEAFTSSRGGLIEMGMADFRMNPAFGMGFQVAWYTPERVAKTKGLALSSPIEKGVMPVMILSETGLVGAAVFMFFLIAFYIGCNNRSLYITLTMFAVLLAVNMGEATFFSPGGPGGTEWMYCIVGGYLLDLSLKNLQRRNIPLPHM